MHLFEVKDALPHMHTGLPSALVPGPQLPTIWSPHCAVPSCLQTEFGMSMQKPWILLLAPLQMMHVWAAQIGW